jgi:hypothetical protein
VGWVRVGFGRVADGLLTAYPGLDLSGSATDGPAPDDGSASDGEAGPDGEAGDRTGPDGEADGRTGGEVRTGADGEADAAPEDGGGVAGAAGEVADGSDGAGTTGPADGSGRNGTSMAPVRPSSILLEPAVIAASVGSDARPTSRATSSTNRRVGPRSPSARYTPVRRRRSTLIGGTRPSSPRSCRTRHTPGERSTLICLLTG